jgi:hypothetical protein
VGYIRTSRIFRISSGFLIHETLEEFADKIDDTAFSVLCGTGLKGDLPFNQIDLVPGKGDDFLSPHPRVVPHSKQSRRCSGSAALSLRYSSCSKKPGLTLFSFSALMCRTFTTFGGFCSAPSTNIRELWKVHNLALQLVEYLWCKCTAAFCYGGQGFYWKEILCRDTIWLQEGDRDVSQVIQEGS